MTSTSTNPRFPVFGLIFFLGATCFVIRLVHALFLVGKVRRTALPVNQDKLQQSFQSVRNRLRISRNVLLLQSTRIAVPMTFGFLKPVVVVPVSRKNDPCELPTEAVLFHELTHVARFDYVIHLIAKTCLCLYWCNPVVWFAWRRMKETREQVCDGYCVNELGDQDKYVEALFDVARRMTKQTNLGIGLAMAGTSSLEHRIANLSPLGRYSASAYLRLMFLIVAVCLSFGMSLAAVAQDNALESRSIESLTIEDIVEGLQKREQSIESMVVDVRFDRTNYFRDPKDGPMPPNRMMDDAVTSTQSGGIHWDLMRDGRGRMEADFLTVNTRFDQSKITSRENITSAYNGDSGMMISVIASENGIPISRLVREQDQLMRIASPPFEFAGLGKFDNSPVHDRQRISDQVSRIIEVSQWNNRPVIVVETDTIVVSEFFRYVQRFWVDPGFGFAVVRDETIAQRTEEMPKGLHLQIDSDEFQEVEPGVWLPKLIESQRYLITDAGQGRLAGHTKIRVINWSVNESIDSALFALELSEIDQQSLPMENIQAETIQEDDIIIDSPIFRNMKVRTVDSSGMPVPGTRIRVNNWPREEDEQSRVRVYLTDQTGSVEVRVPDRPSIVRIWAQREGYVPMFANWEPRFQVDADQMPTEFTFQLPSGTKIGGTVVNQLGEPIEGVIVEVELGNNVSGWGRRPVTSRLLSEADDPGSDPCVTDANGKWSLNNVPAGAEVIVRCKLTHPDYSSDTSWGELQKERRITTNMLRAETATFVMRPKTVPAGN